MPHASHFLPSRVILALLRARIGLIDLRLDDACAAPPRLAGLHVIRVGDRFCATDRGGRAVLVDAANATALPLAGVVRLASAAVAGGLADPGAAVVMPLVDALRAERLRIARAIFEADDPDDDLPSGVARFAPLGEIP